MTTSLWFSFSAQNLNVCAVIFVMPGEAGSPHWVAVDFESEGDDEHSPVHSHRIYIDPWDNEAYGRIHADAPESSHGENFNSFVGEPVSASFYYVPTKNYDSGEESVQQPRRQSPLVDIIVPESQIYARRFSRALISDYHPDFSIYGDKPTRDRRRSMYIEPPMYPHHPILYEPLYGHIPPTTGYLPPPPRSRMSLPHHPEYMMAALTYNKRRRRSRLTEAYEHFTYETLSRDYEDWARPFPKTAPDNFHLSRYGHLQIDYSCSWNSLDRLIRNS